MEAPFSSLRSHYNYDDEEDDDNQEDHYYEERCVLPPLPPSRLQTRILH